MFPEVPNKDTFSIKKAGDFLKKVSDSLFKLKGLFHLAIEHNTLGATCNPSPIADLDGLEPVAYAVIA
jgi:hypothetical protein